MRSFADRLAGLSSAGPGSRAAPAKQNSPEKELQTLDADTPKDERIAKIRAALGAMTAASAHRAVASTEPRSTRVSQLGERVQHDDGAMHVCTRRYDVQHHHGRSPVARALQMQADALATLAIDPALAHVDPTRALYFDTETTGLAGGTGTVPFLIGLGWFEQGEFVVEQLLLPDLGGEAPLLRRLAERIAQASVLVSFNGKSFDWPLLRSRFVLNRTPLPTLPPHVDLLHCARRVFRGRLQAMRLTQIEMDIFSFEREGDISGAEVPQIFFDWLRRRDDDKMRAVIEHNAWDIVALAALMGEMSQRFESICDADPRDQLALARVALRAKDGLRASEFATAAAESGVNSVVCEAYALLAELHRKQGDHEKSAQALVEALQRDEGSAMLHFALAKLYEHAFADYERALTHARRAADMEAPEASEKRIARLMKKAQSKARAER